MATTNRSESSSFSLNFEPARFEASFNSFQAPCIPGFNSSHSSSPDLHSLYLLHILYHLQNYSQSKSPLETCPPSKPVCPSSLGIGEALLGLVRGSSDRIFNPLWITQYLCDFHFLGLLFCGHSACGSRIHLPVGRRVRKRQRVRGGLWLSEVPIRPIRSICTVSHGVGVPLFSLENTWLTLFTYPVFSDRLNG